MTQPPSHSRPTAFEAMTMHVTIAADAAIERYGNKAPARLLELIAAAVRDGDDDQFEDFDRTLREVERRLGIEGDRAP